VCSHTRTRHEPFTTMPSREITRQKSQNSHFIDAANESEREALTFMCE
jgi:hypothetical protein